MTEASMITPPEGHRPSVRFGRSSTWIVCECSWESKYWDGALGAQDEWAEHATGSAPRSAVVPTLLTQSVAPELARSCPVCGLGVKSVRDHADYSLVVASCGEHDWLMVRSAVPPGL